MTAGDWLYETKHRLRQHGKTGAKMSIEDALKGVLQRGGKFLNYGETCWRREWDILVLLDACRHDLLQEAAELENYHFLPEEIPAINSCASMSKEYFESAFSDEHVAEMEDTALITSNGFSSIVLDGDEFAHVDEVFRSGWSDEDGTTPPREVTDRAIDYWRSRPSDVNRMIVWYMQPHAPFRSITDVERGSVEDVWDRDTTRTRVWDLLRRNQLSRGEVWSAYQDNLQWVLDDVEVLLDNVTADTVAITSDHGNAFGEFGCYAHPANVPIPALKRVPWVELSATDSKTYEPEYQSGGEEQNLTDGEVEDQLEALGYK